MSNLQKPQKASSKLMLYLVQLALIIFYITIHQFSFHLINENLAGVNVPDLVKNTSGYMRRDKLDLVQIIQECFNLIKSW